ncbi:GntR family transcriptional regulator [Prauserella cavernicola]|uniref:GntR family transcriptional regulator n=1 Tax=Prauserella cavernicola TaxID=2800127 RepID=UPI0027DE87B4|nr:GntR family transcriptional regulator [Prauserella cavernicola]
MGTKVDQVYRALRDDILAHRAEQGAALDEAALAGSFGVSRTPVREALRLLQSEGLLVAGPRRQLFVVDLSDRHRREVAILRDALEGSAAVEACEQRRPEDLDALRLLVLKQRRAARSADAEAFLGLDEEFHRDLAGVARMPTLSTLLGHLGAFVRLARIGEPTGADHMLGLADEHDHLLDLLEARDAEGLRTALSTHIHDTGQRSAGPADG